MSWTIISRKTLAWPRPSGAACWPARAAPVGGVDAGPLFEVERLKRVDDGPAGRGEAEGDAGADDHPLRHGPASATASDQDSRHHVDQLADAEPERGEVEHRADHPDLPLEREPEREAERDEDDVHPHRQGEAVDDP